MVETGYLNQMCRWDFQLRFSQYRVLPDYAPFPPNFARGRIVDHTGVGHRCERNMHCAANCHRCLSLPIHSKLVMGIHHVQLCDWTNQKSQIDCIRNRNKQQYGEARYQEIWPTMITDYCTISIDSLPYSEMGYRVTIINPQKWGTLISVRQVVLKGCGEYWRIWTQTTRN